MVLALWSSLLLTSVGQTVADSGAVAPADTEAVAAASIEELIGDDDMAALEEMAAGEASLHQQLKTKFVEGSAGFMSLVALALVLGLAFCIERISISPWPK